MPYDLFVSYSRRDNEQGRVTQLVERISRDFEQFAGRPLRPFLDVTEIHGMQDWEHRILQGLRESRLLLACLSPSYLKSEYCEWEFNEYLKHEVARGFIGEGVAPIYFIEVPGWDGRDFEQRCADWIKDLRRRQYFDLRPWYHEGEEALRNSEIQQRLRDLGQQIQSQIYKGEVVERSLGNVDRHNPHFIGRVSEMRRLRETVSSGQVGVLAAVHGLGGMGKTALAIEYAHVFAHEYGGGRWQVRCEARDDLRLAIASLAPALNVEFNEEEKLDLDLQLARILAELRRLADAHEPHQCLLLLDNVDQPALLEPTQSQRLPAAGWLHVIVTTRLGEDELHGHQPDRRFLSVEELPEEEAIGVIESYQPSGRFLSDEERDAATEIVRLLGRLTLACEIAAVFLGQFAGEVSCAAFMERLRREGLTGLETAARETTAGVLHGEKQVTATLAPTLESLTAPVKLAVEFAALLPADYVALPWIRALVAEDFPEIGIEAEPGHPDPWLSLLRRLLSLRLWQPTNAKDQEGGLLVLRMHRLLQDVVNRRAVATSGMLEERLIRYAKERCTFLEEGWLDWQNRWEIDPLRALSEALLAREHEEASWIADSVSQRLFIVARYPEAEQLMRQALAIDELSYGPEHPDVASDLNNLAQLLKATNRLTEAEPLMRRALAIDEQKYGPEHPDVARDLNNLASLLQATNRLTEAEPLMRRVLAIGEESYGPEHPHVATALNNLAQLLQATNRLTEAESLMRRALAIDEESYGPEHPHVATALNNLSSLLQGTNRLKEAEPLMRRVVEIFEQSYGTEHPNVATALNNLASLLQAANRLKEAEPLMRRALAIDEQSYGPEHPDVARDLNNLAWLLQATNRLKEAEPLMRRVVEIFERSCGAEHPNVATALNNLAQLLQATNRLAEAERLMRRNLQIFLRFTRTTHHEHPHLRTALKNYVGLSFEMETSQELVICQLRQIGPELVTLFFEEVGIKPQSGETVQGHEQLNQPAVDETKQQAELMANPAVATQRPTKRQPYDDDVMFTVYRPKTIVPMKWYAMLAFAHLAERRPYAPPDEPDPIVEVQRQAQQILGKRLADYKQSSDESSTAIPRAGELTFKPFIEGVEFNPASRSFRWEESVHREEFKMRASSSLDGQTARGWLRVYLGPLI
ncbi:MAG: tetratricopeptide repeat protein, partial [Pyrinomonadaceae bacterium]